MRRRHLPALLSLPLLTSLAAHAAPAPQTWFIFLEAGRKTPADKAAVAAMQAGHIANFKRLFGLGQLLAAGPMRDPAGLKRGIVVAQAASRDELMSYFQPDDYVREGHMTINASPARVHKALNTTGIEPDKIEEGRIVLIGRDASSTPELDALRHQVLQILVDQGRFGAWYSLDSGPQAEVLFARGADSAAPERALSMYPALTAENLTIMEQWLSKGVIP